MTRAQAWKILTEWTKSDSLLRHARSVELVMRRLAQRYGEDEELWGAAGLLHDADYESFPDRHPQVTVERLRVMGEHALAHAVSAHYTRWGVPYESLMDKALVAADELTGFVTACSFVHPEGVAGLTSASVLKKFKQKAFAAKVDREEMRRGAEILGIDPGELTDLIIEVLRENRTELGLR